MTWNLEYQKIKNKLKLDSSNDVVKSISAWVKMFGQWCDGKMRLISFVLMIYLHTITDSGQPTLIND